MCLAFLFYIKLSDLLCNLSKKGLDQAFMYVKLHKCILKGNLRKMTDKPTFSMKKRLNIFILGVFAAIVVYLIYSIFTVTVRDAKMWQELANSQQLQSTVVKASRGTIFDATSQVLAQSSTVYTVYTDPVMLGEQLKAKDEKIEKIKKDIAEEDNDEKRAEYQKTLDKCKSKDQLYEELVAMLADELQVETKFVRERCEANSMYEVIKKEVEKTTCDRIDKFMSDNDLDGVRCEPTTKRFYPQNELAGAVLGYINADGEGVYGLEAYYDDYLSGIDGRSVTAKDRDGEAIPYKYKQSFDAQDGNSLYLNIDTTIQLYLESALKKSVDEFNPKERACGIIMNPKTGQVYAMATVKGCDPNNPNEIYDEAYAATLSGMDEESEEYHKAHIGYLTKQWTNKAISELYYPGSVFKVITGSSALEEKAITLDGPFTCSGTYTVLGQDVHCWNLGGHGSQSFAEAIINSCNPAFMEIGAKLGIKGFCDYFKAYGLTEKTGIDLPNEADSFYYSADTMSELDLAVSSFGQANKITPIQMITAYSACINGGYLVTPQIVNKIVDSNGNIVKEFDPVIKRQVISEETSKDMRDTLEFNVSSTHSGNCYIQGYKIGGKSGTSQKLDVDPGGQIHVGSYCAFAPADDPEVIILVMVDEPQGSRYYGAQVALPVCVESLEQVLPYLGFFPEYTEEELTQLQVSVPNQQYQPLSDAKSTLEALGVTVKVVGNGDSVIKQCPAGGAMVKSGTVILYTDETAQEMKTVPSLLGLNKETAIEVIEQSGLNICVKGNDSDEEKATAQGDQSVAAGESVPEGTIVSVTITAVDALHE